MSPFTTDFPIRPTMRRRPNIMTAKNSGGPKRRAKRAMGGPRKVRQKTATTPPMKDPIAATPSAAPARPWRAI